MDGLVMLLACMMAETGTPCWREIISSVSPGATVIGVPPSQVQAGGGGAAGTEPVISVLRGSYDAMPWPPPEDPCGSTPARCGIGRLSTWPAGVLCGIDPVVSLRDVMANIVVDNILALLDGRTPPNCVNPQVLAT